MATIPTLVNGPKFSDHPKFKPHYTPHDMLQLGVYGGHFFFYASRNRGLPDILFDGLPNDKLESASYDAANNHFAISPIILRSTIPINAKVFSGGWFGWYCKFFYGYNNPTMSQFYVDHWYQCVKMLTGYFTDANRADLGFKPEIRQTLLELGFDSTKTMTWVAS